MLALGFVGAGTALGGEGGSQAGEKVKVGCWNGIFPSERVEPEFYKAPRKCLWWKRNAETIPEGAEVVLGKRLRWEWGDRRATAEGRVKVEGVGDRFGEGRVRLLKPVESCGRTVFSKLRYRTRSSEGRRRGEFPLYTCRSRPGQD